MSKTEQGHYHTNEEIYVTGDMHGDSHWLYGRQRKVERLQNIVDINLMRVYKHD